MTAPGYIQQLIPRNAHERTLQNLGHYEIRNCRFETPQAAPHQSGIEAPCYAIQLKLSLPLFTSVVVHRKRRRQDSRPTTKSMTNIPTILNTAAKNPKFSQLFQPIRLFLKNKNKFKSINETFEFAFLKLVVRSNDQDNKIQVADIGYRI